MAYYPEHRITADFALQDPWITKHSHKELIASNEVIQCIENLKAFKAISSLQKAVLSYMASHVVSKEEEKKLREVFSQFDTNGDGQLSQEELLEGYKQLYGGEEELAQEAVSKIMNNIDINKNGTIDYNGTWIVFNLI